MPDKNLTIFKSYLGEIETEEQDLVLYNDIFTDEELEENHPDTIETEDFGTWSGESTPIKIDEVIETLKSFKSDGANYVEIYHHGDHYTYIFNALSIRKATPEEIEKNEEDQKKAREFHIKEKIRKYEAEINKLSNEIL